LELYEKRLFEEVLNLAVSQFCERVTQRLQGGDRALAVLRENPEADGVWLSQYTANFFQDNLLDNTAGALFILSALERQKLSIEFQGTAGDAMQVAARQVFSALLLRKAIESIESSLAFGG
jgi:hypothetical protein